MTQSQLSTAMNLCTEQLVQELKTSYTLTDPADRQVTLILHATWRKPTWPLPPEEWILEWQWTLMYDRKMLIQGTREEVLEYWSHIHG